MSLTTTRRGWCAWLILSFLVAACSTGAVTYPEQVFGVIGGCTPLPTQATNFLYSPGGLVLEEGQTLSDLTVETDSPTGFAGAVRVTVVDDTVDPALRGFGLEYNESSDLFSSPATVTGPGNAHIVIVVEASPNEETIIFSRAEFTIDNQRFVSFEGDAFELQIGEDAC